MGKGGCADNGLVLKAKDHSGTPTSKYEKENNGVTDTVTSPTTSLAERKWWNRGGMRVNELGMAINITSFGVLLVTSAPTSSSYKARDLNIFFAGVLLLNIAMAVIVHKKKTPFCIAMVPFYMTSLLVLGTFQLRHLLPIIIVTNIIGAARVGICMSVCLHRYAAHAAFKCGPVTQLALNILGSAAHQGGAIWWASMHRCHHKHCDLPRDPHSAIQSGTEYAFAFFCRKKNLAVSEEFAPKHCDNWYLRLLDTWSFLVCTVEMALAYQLLGREGLFISYSSIWICQTITLWFNIANHPEDAPGSVCKAANFKARPEEYYPIYHFLDLLYPYYGAVVGELGHENHHKHFMLAKRDSTDLAYFCFILPLEVMGLVWDVKKEPLE